MKIGIIGAGSIGLLFGAYLGKNFDVTIFPRRKEQAYQLNNKGITIQNKLEYHTYVHASIDKNELNRQDLLIITVKQYQLKSILKELKNLHNQIPLLFLQNGMLHLAQINELNSDHIYVGTIEHGALKVSDTSVQHNGVGKTNIAVFRGKAKKIEQVLTSNIKDFDFELFPDYEKMLLKKLLINMMINPLTAILKVRNGQLIENIYYNQIFLQLFDEVMLLFPKEHKEKLLKDLLIICNNTKNNESSMLRDIQLGRRTEIDAIAGYLVNVANKKGVNMPLTKMLIGMIKGMERGGVK